MKRQQTPHIRSNRIVWLTSVYLHLVSGGFMALADESPMFDVPPGFHVSVYASDELAHDIYSMTLDAQGRVVVSGRGYVKILHDDDGDSRADRATLFVDEPASGARGLFFDGPDLICTGDNALARYRDRDGDRVADGPREVLAELAVGKDHSANGVVQGPDGWFYVACGNDAAVTSRHTQPGSPVRQPHQGVVFRCSPDGQEKEVVAHGFRNPYDLAFAENGAMLLVDADGERDQYLPWYSPTRLFDVAQGMHHGWMLPGWVRSWNRPPWFFDNVDRLVEIGRGSPTGAVVYRHRQFPTRYRNAMFSACWSLGRIYCCPLKVQGESFASQLDLFLAPRGNAGFAPVDLAVGPQGEMYVAIGGRGTRGGVYRIDYRGEDSGNEDSAQPTDVQRVLAADQPLASWSRARWLPSARKLGKAPFAAAVLDRRLPEQQRVRAIEVLTELFTGVDGETANAIVKGDRPALKARLAWSLGRVAEGNVRDRAALLARLTHDANIRVQRAAWESLTDLPELDAAVADADWSDAFGERPRRLRAAAILVAARTNAWRGRVSTLDVGVDPWAACGMLRRKVHRSGLTHADLDAALGALVAARPPSLKLEAVRLMQLCLGDVRAEPTRPDVYAGYEPRLPLADDHAFYGRAIPLLCDALPSSSPELDREISRLLGMLGRPQAGLPEKIAAHCSEASTVEDDIHYLIVLSRLPGERSPEVTRATAAALARLHHKMRRGKMYSSRFWPTRVGETFSELLNRDAALGPALIADEQFGLTDHGCFADRLDTAAKTKATLRIIDRVGDIEDWNPQLVRLSASLPADQWRTLLHEAWDQPALRDVIAIELAREPTPDDRPLFIEILRFGQPGTVRAAADALRRLPANPSPAEFVTAISAMRQFSRDQRYAEVNVALDRLLAAWTSQAASPKAATALERYQRWEGWLAETDPKFMSQLRSESTDLASWRKRLASIDWQRGDAARGKQVFARRACARCHVGNARLGPRLDGIGRRFSREDLFTAILDPNRDVSPAYWSTQLTTASGRVVSGQILYESPESTLVQTGPDTTVRITGEIVSIQKSPLSPMPTGLLREASDEELADLYAWLKTLGEEQP